ncbi:uncharacterized protein [Rhodnius prolixus]|uniref:uncharacterized protein n=1 Tax=Rhodnius prolixus TaxID=13249 RepID=UPI003D18A9CA
MRTLLLLAAISSWYCCCPCYGYGILTKNMIKTPEETRYERVALLTREGVKDNASITTSTSKPTTEILETTTKTEEENYEDEYEEEEDDEDEGEEDENDEELAAREQRDNSKEVGNVTVTTPTERMGPTGRTRLYPVENLWEKTSPDFWTVLSTAVGCLWNGLGMDCFTYRVVPMVKSMMGYSHYTEFHPFYSAASREDDTQVVEGRRRKHHLLGLFKLMKGALAGAIGLKTLLLPVLAGLALVAGKSLFISLASIILSAIAAWTGVKYGADRRVQAGPIDSHSQYYMM